MTKQMLDRDFKAIFNSLAVSVVADNDVIKALISKEEMLEHRYVIFEYSSDKKYKNFNYGGKDYEVVRNLTTEHKTLRAYSYE